MKVQLHEFCVISLGWNSYNGFYLGFFKVDCILFNHPIDSALFSIGFARSFFYVDFFIGVLRYSITLNSVS